MFRRRRQTDDALAPVDDDVEPAADDESDAALTTDEAPLETAAPAPKVSFPPQGPWDSGDAPALDEERAVLDLGSLRVPVPEGLEVRVEVQDDVVVAATFVDGESTLQVHAFAAPRSGGLWVDVRTEIAESLQESAGSAEEVPGPFGVELRARIPAESGQVPARFLGVDGPRWFLRGLVTGPAATNPQQAGALEATLREIVVHRGTDAMAPRDLLPLQLPREALEATAEALEHVEQPSLSLPERGPEITETQ